jgi:hypothetical protein
MVSPLVRTADGGRLGWLAWPAEEVEDPCRLKNNRRILYGVSTKKFEMASKIDLDFTYTTIDEIFRLSIGEMADYSGARFDGDFSMTLEEAQKRKHAFIADSLGINGTLPMIPCPYWKDRHGRMK